MALKVLAEIFSTWRSDLKDLLVLGVPVTLANAMRIAFFVTNNAFIVRPVEPWPIPNAAAVFLRLFALIEPAPAACWGKLSRITFNVGHLGEQALAAATLATSWMNCSIYFGVGLIFALDTYISQAFGAKNFKLIGIVFQNSLVVSTLISIPIAIMWWFTEPILFVLGQGEEISRLSGEFTKWSIPGVVGYLYYRAMMRYLQNQRIMWPAVIVGAIGVVQNVFMNQLLVRGMGSWQGLGFIGGPIASSIAWISHPLMLWGYVLYSGVQKKSCASGCEREAFSPRRIWDFLKLGVPSSLMLVLEVIGFEIITLLIGAMKNDAATSAHSVLYSVTSVAWVLPSGIGNGAATKIGNLLGEQKSDRAHHFSTFASVVLLGVELLIAILLMAFRYAIPLVYSEVPAVIEMSAQLMPLGVMYTFFDGLATIGASILRGIGRQNIGTIITFTGFYIICIPVGVGLGIGFNGGLTGLWWGVCAGITTTAIGYYVYIYLLVDWKEEERLAYERVSEEATGLHNDNPDALIDEEDIISEDNDVVSLGDIASLSNEEEH